MKHYFLLFWLFLGFLGLPSTIVGQEENPAHEPSPQESHLFEDRTPVEDRTPEFFPEHGEREADTFPAKFMNMLFILGLLIAFMVLASWALKRMMKTRLTQLNTSSTIKVLETRHLSPRSTLYLLDVQGQGMLIAESPTSVTHLASIALDDEHKPLA